MLLPVFEDEPHDPRLPWLTLGLAALWLAVYAAARAGAPLEPQRFGLVGAACWSSLGFASLRETCLPGALTFFALHTGAGHLAASLLLLGLSGPALESRWGRPGFAGFLLTLLGLQALGHVLAGATPARPVVGASAALAGLVAAATLRFLRTGLALRVGVGPRAPVLALPSAVLPVLWFAAEVALDLTSGLAGPTHGHYAVAAAAAALGAATAWGVAASGLEERWLRSGAPSAWQRRRTAQLLARVAESQVSEPPQVAYELLEAALRAPASDVRLGAAFWDVAGACRCREQALPLLLDCVAGAWRRGRRSDALALWRSLLADEPAAPLELGLRLGLAGALAAAGERRDAALTLRGALAGRLSGGAALRLAESARPIHPDTAIDFARLALRAGALDPAKRVKIEAWIETLEGDPARLDALELGSAPAVPGPTLPESADPPEDPRALVLEQLDGNAAELVEPLTDLTELTESGR